MNPILTTVIFTYLFTFSASTNKEQKSADERFEVEFQWSNLNYTWQSPEVYQNALDTKRYIPQNMAMSGMKFYKDKFYFGIPRLCPGTPVTLGYIDTTGDTSKTDRLITPFPSWYANDLSNHTCEKLENVQSLEIDADGIMWVLDGVRLSSDSQCPPKLVLYDLNNNSDVIQTFTFPDEICLSKGGFLNDIVVDDSGGGFAYITDSSSIDPGLIVYSKSENRAWKLRDPTMFPDLTASGFVVDNVTFSTLIPINGIGLSPKTDSGSRTVYYSALTGLRLYSISTDILKNENLVSAGNWRVDVTYVGSKQAQGDGMVGDNEGNLYYGLLPLYGVGKWNAEESFSTLDVNSNTLIWTYSFSFDDKGYVYVLANQIHHIFLDSRCEFAPSEEIRIRILKYFTGTKSYLY